MQEREIRNEQDLDVAIASSVLSKQQRLWKAASGKSPRWADVLMVILGVLQFGIGVLGVISDGDPDSIVILAIGALLVCFSLWRIQESRIDAIHELLRSMDSGDR
jgi:hypothetical protein